MAVALTSASNGQVGINGVPIQRGTIDLNHIDFKNEKLTAHVRGQHNPVIKEAAYTEITIDGVAAANWNAVKTFVEENFFFDVDNGGGGGGNVAYAEFIAPEETSIELGSVAGIDTKDKEIIVFIEGMLASAGTWNKPIDSNTLEFLDGSHEGQRINIIY